MNIAQLIESTNQVSTTVISESGTGKKKTVAKYGPENTFQNKKFGQIFLYNKVVRVKPRSSIVEVTMMIKGVTDKIRAAKDNVDRPVAAHKVMVAIRGVEQKVVDADTLIGLIRMERPEYKDETAYPNEDILARAINPDFKPFEGKTIMAQANGTYVIITDQISPNNDIRVWCSCSNYYWVFQYYNVENNVDIWGKAPSRYIPKTKTGWEAFTKNKPMRNPGRHPGMCKHIMLLLALLMDSSVVSAAGGMVNQYRANIKRFKKVDRLSESEYNKLMKDYASDHRRKLQQRNMNRTEAAGYAQLAGFQRKNVGWNKGLGWNPNSGWRKS